MVKADQPGKGTGRDSPICLNQKRRFMRDYPESGFLPVPWHGFLLQNPSLNQPRITSAGLAFEGGASRCLPGQLAPYLAYLVRRLGEGCSNAAQLWRELREQGFLGSYSAVYA